MTEPLNVLIIEDSETDATLVLRELRRGGFNPIWERVQTDQEFRTALNKRTWDVILSDYRLPGFNAPTALEIVKQTQKDIPFILVSGTIGEIFAVQMMKAGAHDYVMKDNLNRLPEAVRREIRDVQVRKERKHAQELLLHNALHDPLTKLPNRTLLEERIELAIHRAKRVETYHYAVLFLDLDRFKVINDSLGHFAGDELLKNIAQKLKNHLRDIDLVSRLGGDEFVILLEDIDSLGKAVQITNRILKDFEIPLIIDNSEVVISTSIGIVLGTKNYNFATDLLRDADIAMYQAKAQGRNSYKIFNAQMHTQAVNRLTVETEIRKAIEREEFIIYYQPIIDIFTSNLIGFEALIRWQHPTRGLILPSEFIPIAEETGLIVPMDYWTLYTACQQLATWKDQFPHHFPLKVNINLSVQDIRQDNLVETIDNILEKTGLEGELITLEITESMLIENIDQTINLLTELKLRKNQISIDDFGTGYSSLNYLHRLPADSLKIDRSFVSQMQEENRNYQVVSTIITLSNQLGLSVVAEGIETPQQLQWLKQLGCEFGQGYLFSKPLAAKEIEAHFLRNKSLLQIIQCF